MCSGQLGFLPTEVLEMIVTYELQDEGLVVYLLSALQVQLPLVQCPHNVLKCQSAQLPLAQL